MRKPSYETITEELKSAKTREHRLDLVLGDLLDDAWDTKATVRHDGETTTLYLFRTKGAEAGLVLFAFKQRGNKHTTTAVVLAEDLFTDRGNGLGMTRWGDHLQHALGQIRSTWTAILHPW